MGFFFFFSGFWYFLMRLVSDFEIQNVQERAEIITATHSYLLSMFTSHASPFRSSISIYCYTD